MNLYDSLTSPRFRRALVWWLAPLAIFIVNVAICGRLFKIEYSANLASNEGQFIAIARGVANHFGDLTWWPEWSCGLPFVNTYLPLVGVLSGLLSRIAGQSPALAFHQVAALFYCLGPAFLYLLGYVMTRKPAASFLAALMFSVVSPCALLPAFRVDLGGWLRLRRLQILAFYGEAPHTVAIAFLPLAILFLYLVTRRATPFRCGLAGLFMALTVLSNAFGAVILAAAAVALLATAPSGRFRRASAAFLTVAALTYCWISPAVPPSVISAIRMNSPTVDGDYRFTSLSAVGLALLAAGFLAGWLASKTWPAHLRAFMLFAWTMTGIVILGVEAKIYVVPQPHRYQIAMDLSLCLLAVFGVAYLLETYAPQARVCAAIALTIFLGVQTRYAIRYARGLIHGADVTKTAMYRANRWLDENLRGQRVMVSGSYSFYTNDFSDVPQLHGGQDPMLPNFTIRIATFTIYSGMNAGDRDAQVSIAWLKALGARAVLVTGPKSEEAYKPFVKPGKFEGSLPVLWRNGDDVIYGVPARSESLAHVMDAGDVVKDPPENGLDTHELERYTAALESPEYPEPQWRWTSRHSAVIDASLAKGQVISVQETYDPGWTATVAGAPQPVSRDGLGLITVKPACQGPCRITLTYTGGAERTFTALLSVLSVVALGLAGLRSRRAARNSRDIDGQNGEVLS